MILVFVEKPPGTRHVITIDDLGLVPLSKTGAELPLNFIESSKS